MRDRIDEQGVSPVIGVMLMIVVVVIIAALVSAFAGGYANDDKKAPTAFISCKVVPAGSGSYPNGALLFTHESGNFINLGNTYMVISSGSQTGRFDYTRLVKLAPKKFDSSGGGLFYDTDREINNGNQFVLLADNTGSSETGGYMGWSGSSAGSNLVSGLVLSANKTATFTLVDRETGLTISSGGITDDEA